MEWTPLPTDYTDANWEGLRKFNMINNPDGTVSLQDVTEYTQRQNSFFGSAEANQMNTGMNLLAENIDDVQEARDTAVNASQTAEGAKDTAVNASASASESAVSASQSAQSASQSAESAEQSYEKISEVEILLSSRFAHNNFIRGQFLGTDATDEQLAHLDELYLGDYWEASGQSDLWEGIPLYYSFKVIVASLTGSYKDVALVVLPKYGGSSPDNLIQFAMDSSGTTSMGYYNSELHTFVKNTLVPIFKQLMPKLGSKIGYTAYLSTSYSDNVVREMKKVESSMILLSQNQIFGSTIVGSNLKHTLGTGECSDSLPQLPIFKNSWLYVTSSVMRFNRLRPWLRDIVDGERFAGIIDDYSVRGVIASTSNAQCLLLYTEV